MKINKHIVAVSFYSPYLINEFPEFQGFIATYSPSQESMDTAIEIIFGKRNPQGKLPSSLSNLYPAGSGFHYEHLIEENNPVK